MKRILFFAIFTLAIALLVNACGSRAMNTAKLAYQKGEFDKAMESLNQELALNPKNGEAWNMLIDIYMKKEDLPNAAKACMKAQENVVDPKFVKEPAAKLYGIWLDAFNKGVNNLNEFIKTKQESNFQQALKYFNLGIEIRPEILQFHSYKAALYEVKGDKSGVESAYNDFFKQLEKFADFAKKSGIALDTKESDAKAKLGAPLEKQKLPSGKDTIFAESYNFDGKEVSVFYQDIKKTGTNIVIGWKPEIPKTWDPREKFQFLDLEINPLGNLAQAAYEKKDYDNALKYLKMFQIFDPSNSDNTAAIFKIYQDAGRLDEAKAALEELIKKDPKNASAWTQYGDIYSVAKFPDNTPNAEILKSYDKAIEKYEKALQADPNYGYALRNIASVYKNKAVLLQKEQISMIESNPKYKEDLEAYFPFLRKSAEYFEKASKTNEFRDDFQVYGELANIYSVLDESAKLKSAMSNLESFREGLRNESRQKREQYLLILLKLYGNLKETTKFNDVEKELNNL